MGAFQYQHRKQSVTKEEFFNRLCGIAKLPKPSESTLKRPVFVSVSYANYGRPSAAIIELEGSPPHLTTMVRLDAYGGSSAMICRKTIGTKSQVRLAAIDALVRDFLQANGYIKQQNSTQFENKEPK